MISLDSTTTANHPTNPTIIFECNDFRRDTGLLLLMRKKDSKFEIHLHNDYTHDAIAMVISINDLVKMFESLEEYFLKIQVESYNND
jgi:hypothetical protein